MQICPAFIDLPHMSRCATISSETPLSTYVALRVKRTTFDYKHLSTLCARVLNTRWDERTNMLKVKSTGFKCNVNTVQGSSNLQYELLYVNCCLRAQHSKNENSNEMRRPFVSLLRKQNIRHTTCRRAPECTASGSWQPPRRSHARRACRPCRICSRTFGRAAPASRSRRPPPLAPPPESRMERLTKRNMLNPSNYMNVR